MWNYDPIPYLRRWRGLKRHNEVCVVSEFEASFPCTGDEFLDVTVKPACKVFDKQWPICVTKALGNVFHVHTSEPETFVNRAPIP